MSSPKYLFVSQRNIVVSSTLGYAIRFERGKPVHVPKAMHAAVLEKGCLPCDEKGKVVDEPEVLAGVQEEKQLVGAPDTQEERNEAIEKAVREILAVNNPKDFTAGGAPNAEVVTMRLGWKTDAKEVRMVWNKMKPEIMGGDKKE